MTKLHVFLQKIKQWESPESCFLSIKKLDRFFSENILRSYYSTSEQVENKEDLEGVFHLLRKWYDFA